MDAVESMEDAIKRIKETLAKNEKEKTVLKEDKEKIEKLLKEQIEELEKNRTQIRKEKDDAKQQIDKEYKKLKEEKGKNEKQFAKDRTKLILRISELKATMNNKNREHEAECKRLNETINQRTQQLNQYYAGYTKGVTEIDRLNAEVQKLKLENQELQTYKNIYSELKQKISSLRKTIQDLENQKEDLMLKLSRIDGANLSGLNPNMAYLSDEKRPTKLAEEFSELYDNEWTDAFEEVEAVDDKSRFKFLYDVLERASDYCADLSTLHDEAIKSSFTTLKYAVTVPITDKVKKQEHGKIIEISRVDFNFDDLRKEQLKMIMDLKKMCEIQQSKDVQSNGARIIADAMNVSEESEQMMKYILKCIDICWSMHRHEPPVHIHFQSHVDGQSFDKNVYRPYTKSSKQLDFVVWPSLHLHKDGPMLRKGFAQGKTCL